MRDRIYEVIKEFTDDNNEFKDTFHTQNEMIRRYDEIISSKANKMTLIEEVSKMNKEYRPRIDGFVAKNTEMV